MTGVFGHTNGAQVGQLKVTIEDLQDVASCWAKNVDSEADSLLCTLQ